MSNIKDRVIEAIKETYSQEIPEGEIITDEEIKEYLYDTVDSETIDHDEQVRVAQIGDRYFQYHRNDWEGINMGSLQEVEPYEETVIKYRKRK